MTGHGEGDGDGGLTMDEIPIDEMERMWQGAKRSEREFGSSAGPGSAPRTSEEE